MLRLPSFSARITLAAVNTVVGCALLQTPASAANPPGVVISEFLYENAPFPRCHASTIEQTSFGLIAAWFGGTGEKHKDVGIWVARKSKNGKWSPPIEVANGIQKTENTPKGGKRYPCWNPVLFQPKRGALLLFYKVGPSPSRWWGMVKTSKDGGKTWSRGKRLPDGILGPIKNKPIQLADGTILSGSSTEHKGWRVHFELSTDGGKRWKRVGPINDASKFGIIQPTILRHGTDTLQALFRSKQRKIVESRSSDGGKTWSAPKATGLPNPNSGIDAVTLKDGRHLLVYNHTTRGRGTLNVAVSNDGKTWKAAVRLEYERGEFSYPAVIQSADGLVHITYTWKRRRVKHVVLDPKKLVLKEMTDGNWPTK